MYEIFVSVHKYILRYLRCNRRICDTTETGSLSNLKAHVALKFTLREEIYALGLSKQDHMTPNQELWILNFPIIESDAKCRNNCKQPIILL